MSKEPEKIILISVANPEEDEALRAGLQAAMQEAVVEAGLQQENLELGGHIGGHGAAWEAYALYAISGLGTVYATYRMIKDGVEIVEDIQKLVGFLRNFSTFHQSVKAKAAAVYEKIAGRPAGARVTSMSEPMAALIATAFVIEKHNPSSIKLNGTSSFPDINDPIFKGKPHTYDYVYEFEFLIDRCTEKCFVHNVDGVLHSVHVMDEYMDECDHGKNSRVTFLQP